MSLIKKTKDKDLKLYLDIVKELKENLTLQLYLFPKKIYLSDLKYKSYYSFRNAKKREFELILERLRKALNIISITKFVDLK